MKKHTRQAAQGQKGGLFIATLRQHRKHFGHTSMPLLHVGQDRYVYLTDLLVTQGLGAVHALLSDRRNLLRWDTIRQSGYAGGVIALLAAPHPPVELEVDFPDGQDLRTWLTPGRIAALPDEMQRDMVYLDRLALPAAGQPPILFHAAADVAQVLQGLTRAAALNVAWVNRTLGKPYPDPVQVVRNHVAACMIYPWRHVRETAHDLYAAYGAVLLPPPRSPEDE